MKKMQSVVGLLTAALLSACTIQRFLPNQTETAVPPTVSPTAAANTSFLCPPASSEAEWECPEMASGRMRICFPVSPSEEWPCYEDLKYGFALAYPPDWKASIEINQPSSNGVVVERRHAFTGPTGYFMVDIIPTFGQDLVAWMDKLREATSPELVPEMKPNARVGGYPAVIFSSGSSHVMLTVFISNGTHAFELLYNLWCEEGEREMVGRILDSFRFSAEPVPAEVPDVVWQQAQELCEQPIPCPIEGPTPTPIPIALPDATTAQDLTANWLVYENSDWGIRFRYPPEYEVTSEPIRQDPLVGRLDVARITKEGYREFLTDFFVYAKPPEISLENGIDAWVHSLPSEDAFTDPDGSVYVVGPIEGPGWKGWYVQLMGPWFPYVLPRVIIPGKEVVIVTDVGGLTGPLDESQLDQMLSQQMAVLATLEIIR